MSDQREFSPRVTEFIRLYLKDSAKGMEEIKEFYWEAIRHFGKQIHVAKRLDLNQQTFNKRFNHSQIIHLEDGLKILLLLESAESEVENQKNGLKGNDEMQSHFKSRPKPVGKTFNREKAVNTMHRNLLDLHLETHLQLSLMQMIQDALYNAYE